VNSKNKSARINDNKFSSSTGHQTQLTFSGFSQVAVVSEKLIAGATDMPAP